MPWNLLLLPLLGGFSFLHFCYRFRFRSQRLQGYRLLFESAVVGVGLSVLARLIILGVVQTSWGKNLAALCVRILPFPFAGTAIAALLLGLTIPFLINLRINRERAKQIAVEEFNDSMLRLLYEAARRKKLVLITLDSRKVYVGFVLNAPNLDRESVHVGLLPILSGYRSSTTLKIHFSGHYVRVYDSQNIDPNDFLIALPLVRVTSAQWFDPGGYAEFSGGGRRVPGETE